jgi:hypothetical protein
LKRVQFHDRHSFVRIAAAALKSKAKDADEGAGIEHVGDKANEIIGVGNKLPPPIPESEKKKKKP